MAALSWKRLRPTGKKSLRGDDCLPLRSPGPPVEHELWNSSVGKFTTPMIGSFESGRGELIRAGYVRWAFERGPRGLVEHHAHLPHLPGVLFHHRRPNVGAG